MLVEAGVAINDIIASSVRPLNIAKQAGVKWMASHLISLGAQETDVKFDTCERRVTARGVRVVERTWSGLANTRNRIHSN
jgi:hypothetical protein